MLVSRATSTLRIGQTALALESPPEQISKYDMHVRYWWRDMRPTWDDCKVIGGRAFRPPKENRFWGGSQ